MPVSSRVHGEQQAGCLTRTERDAGRGVKDWKDNLPEFFGSCEQQRVTTEIVGAQEAAKIPVVSRVTRI
jgi:hypothetical protein